MPVFDPSHPGLASALPAASVVVPSYQAACHIRSMLRSLVAQDTSLAYEIIVVDSSTDGTDRIVAEEFAQVRLLHFDRRCHVGAARNLGIEAAKGEIILFLDTDTVAGPTWVAQMCRALLEGKADAVGGSMRNGTPWSVTGSVGFYLEFFRFLEYNGRPRPTRFLVGGNSGFRRDVLKDIEYLDHPGGEDMLLSWLLALQGRNLLFLPRAAVKHQNRTGFRRVVGYQRQLGRGAFLYRSLESPRSIRLLRAAPPLICLMPFAVMIWIACTLLLRRRIADLLRFAVILPACFIANAAWASGFYESLRQAGKAGGAQERIRPSANKSHLE